MIGTATRLTLSQASGVSGLNDQQADILFWCSVLIVAILVFVVTAMALRKRFTADDSEPDAVGMGFSLADLRAMHERGELSDVEFDYAKRKLIARTRQSVGGDDGADGPVDLWSAADKAENIQHDPDKNGDAGGGSGTDEENGLKP